MATPAREEGGGLLDTSSAKQDEVDSRGVRRSEATELPEGLLFFLRKSSAITLIIKPARWSRLCCVTYVSIRLYEDIAQNEEYCENPHRYRYLFESAGNGVGCNVRDDSDEDTVGDAVCKRHKDDRDESGDALAIIFPVDALH